MEDWLEKSRPIPASLFLCKLELENELMVGRVRPVEREAVVCRQGQRAGSVRIQRPDLQRRIVNCPMGGCAVPAVPAGIALRRNAERDVLFGIREVERTPRFCGGIDVGEGKRPARSGFQGFHRGDHRNLGVVGHFDVGRGEGFGVRADGVGHVDRVGDGDGQRRDGAVDRHIARDAARAGVGLVGGERRDCRRHTEHSKGDNARENSFESVFHLKTSMLLFQPQKRLITKRKDGFYSRPYRGKPWLFCYNT